jgi:hypothetical protein
VAVVCVGVQVVHLKRFQYEGLRREKIDCLVHFPLEGTPPLTPSLRPRLPPFPPPLPSPSHPISFLLSLVCGV